MVSEYVVNPSTGRKIKRDGPTHRKLKSKGIDVCPNKYPHVASKNFCGSEGGSCARSYPVNTTKRARAALAYAHYAPDQEGLKRCARRKLN